jgi:hypothetical protein
MGLFGLNAICFQDSSPNYGFAHTELLVVSVVNGGFSIVRRAHRADGKGL